MTSVFRLRLTAALFPCAMLVAQNVTVPSVMNGVEGGSGSNVPFGSNLACRYQCIFDANTLPWTGPRLISGIKIRADNGNPTTPGSAIAAKGYLDVSIMLSTTSTNAATASNVFDDNRGVDRQWVLQAQPVQLPAQSVTSTPGPRPANIDLPFTTPFWYGLTPAHNNQPAPANLMVEIWIASQPSGSYRLDNLGGCQSPVTTFGNQGPQCAAAGLSPPTLSSDLSMVAGGNFSWYVDSAPPNAPFVLVFSASSQGWLYGQPAYPLPYPMFDPQDPTQPSAALASLNWPAPDCWINIDPNVTLFGTCDNTGYGALLTQLPSGGNFVGFEVFTQALIYAQTANPLRVISTPGRSASICGPIDVTRIFAFYDNSGTPSPPVPTTGQAQYGLGMVFEVQ